MTRRLFTLLSFLVISGTTAFSQENSEFGSSLNTGTIESQFEYIYRTSNNFQEYEVVKKANLEALKSHILDSLKAYKDQIVTLKTEKGAQADSVLLLSGELARAVNEKEAAIEAKESFSFLGMNIQKSLYSSMMWIIVAVLGAMLLFFSLQYFKSSGRIRKAQKDLEDLQGEFEQHRKNALDRERKLKRELIDAQMGKNQ
ncbi:MAG: hypothetical protein B7Z16_01765 [Algoriphagus sp. 32-45-6]|nr:MAG: hypothetical protein B7Z16_01765 [Algoriphagus sp. 32-45-6]